MDDAGLIQRLLEAEEIETVHGECRRIAGHLGFSHFLYGARIPTPIHKPCQLILSGYPAAWRARYDEQEYMRVDPVVHHSLNGILPIDWDRTDRSNPLVAQLFDEAADFGLRHGMTIPGHGPNGEFSLFSIASDRPLPDKAEARMELHWRAEWLATHIQEAVRRIAMAAAVPIRLRGEPPPRLTPRERECLRRAARGANTSAIADELRISERTVVYHFTRCQEKLGVRSRSQAVAHAMTLGELQPDCYPSTLGQSVLVEKAAA
jgi:DNA-binding CsgD family transcriptional regulator